MCDMHDAHPAGYVSAPPHYNTIAKYLELADLTPLLRELVTLSSLPLKSLETTFAVDSSGFSSRHYTRWFDTKRGEMPMERHDWKKLHIVWGVKTNVVTAVEVTGGNEADYPQFAPLVAETAKHFTVKQVSPDKAYSGKFNVAYVSTLGAFPLIPFKENATTGQGPMGIWRLLFHYFNAHRDTFMKHYHQGSNVETTFQMIKSKFGEALRSKSNVAQFNEALCEMLTHNLCCVIQSMHELGIAPDFAPAAQGA